MELILGSDPRRGEASWVPGTGCFPPQSTMEPTVLPHPSRIWGREEVPKSAGEPPTQTFDDALGCPASLRQTDLRLFSGEAAQLSQVPSRQVPTVSEDEKSLRSPHTQKPALPRRLETWVPAGFGLRGRRGSPRVPSWVSTPSRRAAPGCPSATLWQRHVAAGCCRRSGHGSTAPGGVPYLFRCPAPPARVCGWLPGSGDLILRESRSSSPCRWEIGLSLPHAAPLLLLLHRLLPSSPPSSLSPPPAAFSAQGAASRGRGSSSAAATSAISLPVRSAWVPLRLN